MLDAKHLLLLVDPAKLGALPLDKLLWLEPQSNLLLGAVDGVRAVADVSADVDGEVTTDGAWGGCEWVGGAEDGAAGLDDVTALPDHGADWAGVHVYRKRELRASFALVEGNIHETRPAKNGLELRSS